MSKEYLSIIDEKSDVLDGLADHIWEHPELAFKETSSANEIIAVLEREGFKVERGLGKIATAFSGTYGNGGPVIGLLGEFDALDGLGQEACSTEKKPYGSACGHGCGHNLLGVGALGAAFAVKRWLETSGKPGTVVFLGCPGEEGGSGKAFMALEGVFDHLDAALSWHPGTHTRVQTNSSLANCQVLYKFDGVSSHAAAAPDRGRSALDAVELMNMGVQFLREHVDPSTRMHCAITDTGGVSPNVIQAHAEVLYLLRGPVNSMVEDLYRRVNLIANGAAMMTETKVTIDYIKACSNTVPNTAIQKMLQKKMEEIPAPKPTDEELRFARELTERSMMEYEDADPKSPLSYALDPYNEVEVVNPGSTDVGDVSWVCPTAQIGTATWALGTPGHSWQVVSQGKTSWAHKMTRYAAKIMGEGAIELMIDHALLEAAKKEHKQRIGEGYKPMIPAGTKPRAMDDFKK